jgi:hypothetical protein
MKIESTLRPIWSRLLSMSVLTAFVCLATSSHARQENAQEKKPEEPKPEVKVEAPVELKTESGQLITRIIEGLNNPTGLAIQPETGIVFVADSGNGQILRVVDGKAEPVITDFPKESLGTTPPLNMGPLNLGFLNKDTLIVGSGGQPAGDDTVRTYTLPTPPAPMKFDNSKVALTLAATEPALPAEGNFFGLAIAPNAVYVTSQGDAAKGWVNVGNRPAVESVDQLARYIPTVEATGVPLPTAITVTPHGYLLVANIGGLGPEKDSVAAFYEAGSKKMLMKLDLGLHDVCSLAYSARRQMYVLDLAWAQAESGGLFRIVEDKSAPNGLKTKLIAKLPHPTAMCFDSFGALYVTMRGNVDDKGNSQGVLVRLPSEENL